MLEVHEVRAEFHQRPVYFISKLFKFFETIGIVEILVELWPTRARPCDQYLQRSELVDGLP